MMFRAEDLRAAELHARRILNDEAVDDSDFPVEIDLTEPTILAHYADLLALAQIGIHALDSLAGVKLDHEQRIEFANKHGIGPA